MTWKDEKILSTGWQILFLILLAPFIVLFVLFSVVSIQMNGQIWWIIIVLALLITAAYTIIAYNWYRTRIDNKGIFMPGLFGGHLILWENIQSIKLYIPMEKILKNSDSKKLLNSFLVAGTLTPTFYALPQYMAVQRMLTLELFDGKRKYKVKIVNPERLPTVFNKHNINFVSKNSELLWEKGVVSK